MKRDSVHVVPLTESELELVQFAIADKVFDLNKRAEAGNMDPVDAEIEIESLRKVVEKCNKYQKIRAVAAG